MAKEIANIRDDATLRGLTSFADVEALAAAFGGVQSAEELGDGFTLWEGDKKKLVGVPMMFVTWSFSEGDYEREDGTKGTFCTARVMTLRDGKTEKWIINDGSTGIAAQLSGLSNGGPNNRPLHAPRGLRVSEYTYTDEKTGKATPASTFYIDVAPAVQ